MVESSSLCQARILSGENKDNSSPFSQKAFGRAFSCKNSFPPQQGPSRKILELTFRRLTHIRAVSRFPFLGSRKIFLSHSPHYVRVSVFIGFVRPLSPPFIKICRWSIVSLSPGLDKLSFFPFRVSENVFPPPLLKLSAGFPPFFFRGLPSCRSVPEE